MSATEGDLRPAVVEAHGHVRGTQSFVQVMAAVWRRPSLTALEVLWRWSVGVFALWLLIANGWRIWMTVTHGSGDAAAIGMAHFDLTDPLAASVRLAGAAGDLLPPVIHIARWLLPLALFAWVIVAALGRTVVLRRLDPRLVARRGSLFVLGLLRVSCLTGTLLLWAWILTVAGHIGITNLVARGMEPNLVVYFAIVITATLVVFVAWCAVSWVLNVAPVLAMMRGLGPWESLKAAFRLGPLRSKLFEINLVMGIVKVALIVLVMVLSSTPLPFETYTTDTFLVRWWIGVLVLYLVASDFFHVVRTSACVALLEAYQGPPAEDM